VRQASLQFGPYLLGPESGVLLRGVERIPLTPKAFEILRVLAQGQGAVVSKQDILDEVWAGSFVEEGSIARHVSDLRKVLGGFRGGRHYIETVPKRGYRLAAPVEPVPEENIGGEKSLLILPFKLLGNSFADESVGMRITDALTTKVATLRECALRPNAEASPSTRTRGNALGRGRQVDAAFVLGGRVQAWGRRVRVTAQLLDAKKGKLVWAESFDGKRSELFEFEDSVAEQVAGALALLFGAQQRKLVSRRYAAESPQAYQRYLQGRYHWNKRSESGLRRAIRFFEQAIRLDPGYAPAHSGIAASYALLPMLAPLPACRLMPKAKVAAVNAIELDETLIEARSALAFVRWHYDWDWAGAERQFRTILDFEPDHVTTHQWYGLLLAELGRFREGIAEARKAQRLEPHSPSICANLAGVLYLCGRFDAAIRVARQALAMDPQSLRARLAMGMALGQQGRLEEAIVVLEGACRGAASAPLAQGALGYAYGTAGRAANAHRVLRDLRDPARRSPCLVDAALTCLGLGNEAEALELLEKACEERDFFLVILKADRRFDRVRATPRFRRILKRIGLAS
jgi:DNA-binding winged helix-turn-helix (wHTH) protein/tetratricopeptide (TPR) repeat protein